MTPLPANLRKSLDKSVVAAREAAEAACRAALNALGVGAGEAPPSITAENRQLRNALRAKQRQLGGEFELLVGECAYEQWHLMLFARFLAENDLLIHPEHGAPVPLEEVAEVAREKGENDPWLLAAHYAEAMLPGIFRPADPCVRLPLAPEGRKELEDILTALPSEVFTADDALGWVYQFWQTKQKKIVNASERKIGGAALAPVTQLFTEHYMVRFLLENSLGAWWAARRPESPLLAEWEYLRYADDGEPAAGRFEDWPESVAVVTVMDPCCGSGHFLVAAFEMLRKMREEEDDLTAREAVDAVLADNLYGLELDARCVQIGAFALALNAWKASGYHELPPLNLACSGIPTRGSLDEWTKLAKGDERLEHALARLHELFREADTLGSLIDPRRAVEDGSLMSVSFEEVAPLLERALANDPDPVAAVFSESAREVAKAATLLAGFYTLVATNVPYLGRWRQDDTLAAYCERCYPNARLDLATAFLQRCCALVSHDTLGLVVPSAWLGRERFAELRKSMLASSTWNLVARLGDGAFSAVSGAVVNVILGVWTIAEPEAGHVMTSIDCAADTGVQSKSAALRNRSASTVRQSVQANQSRVTLREPSQHAPLSEAVDTNQGIGTSDSLRFVRGFWERGSIDQGWCRLQSTPEDTTEYGGRTDVVFWEDGYGAATGVCQAGAMFRGQAAWGRLGVATGQMSRLPATLYSGDRFDASTVVFVPKVPELLPALWAFLSDPRYEQEVRILDSKLKLSNATMAAVPFDIDHWQQVAEDEYQNGLPEPHSEDPSQWLFKGNIVSSEHPLHVALVRLLGYHWPDQGPDELDVFADDDGIVCLPPVAGERPAHERLRELLTVAYGDGFSQQTVDKLLAPEASRTLEDWVRDKAFANHAKLFHTRPFIWHLWDGRKDGFAALVNYHRLDHQTLQKITYTSLGWWIDRQRADAADEVAGADARLAAAAALQDKLKLILEGEEPYDIHVRWKPLAEQPLGWQPDLNDGVRLNVRPFVTAGVLRARFSIHWRKDRGKNPDGSERLNDLHFTLAEKRAAREESGTSG